MFNHFPTDMSLLNRLARHIYSVIVGLALLYYPFGASIVHLAPPCIVIYLAMLSVPRHAGTVAWAVAMPCLIYWSASPPCLVLVSHLRFPPCFPVSIEVSVMHRQLFSGTRLARVEQHGVRAKWILLVRTQLLRPAGNRT